MYGRFVPSLYSSFVGDGPGFPLAPFGPDRSTPALSGAVDWSQVVPLIQQGIMTGGDVAVAAIGSKKTKQPAAYVPAPAPVYAPSGPPPRGAGLSPMALLAGALGLAAAVVLFMPKKGAA